MQRYQLSRFEQHIDLPQVDIDGQDKIYNSSVLVIGAGGLGCPVLSYLAYSGIGKIGVVDADTVSISNLQRQVLYDYEDIELLKVESAKKRLEKVLYNQSMEIYPVFLNEHNARNLIKQYDFVIDACDNHLTRLIINKVCNELGKPWVYGSVYHYEGQYMVFQSDDIAPCYSCIFHNMSEDSNMPNCAQAGVLSSVPGIIGSCQVTELLKLITGQKIRNELIVFNFLNNNFEKIRVKKNNNCKTCSE